MTNPLVWCWNQVRMSLIGGHPGYLLAIQLFPCYSPSSLIVNSVFDNPRNSDGLHLIVRS
jgi:hypothetical protein